MEIIYICKVFNLYMEEKYILTKIEGYKINFIEWFQLQNIKTCIKYTEKNSKKSFLC